MKKPIVLILIGIFVVLLASGIVFVVKWIGKIAHEVAETSEQHRLYTQTLEAFARTPLTEDQENLLTQLLQAEAIELEGVLSNESYLTYLKMRDGEVYTDFSVYVAAMPTENHRSVVSSRLKAVLGEERDATELQHWLDYYFKIWEWCTTVPEPRAEIGEMTKLQQEHLIEPLMEHVSEASGLSSQMVQMGMFSKLIIEDTEVFQHAWRERIEMHGVQEGMLRCAIATPDEFALMRSFFVDATAFQEWILAQPETEQPADEVE